MKYLATILLFLSLNLPARGQSTVTATITVTTAPTNGQTLTIAGTVFRWTNNPVTLAQIATTNTAAKSATNLYTKLASAVTNRYLVRYGSATSVTLQSYVGQIVSASASAGWATVIFATNTAAGLTLGAEYFRLNGVTIHDWTDIGTGSATNAIGTVKTNGVSVGVGLANLDFIAGANTTVTGALSGATAQVAFGVNFSSLQPKNNCIWVSPLGSDTESGTIVSPFKTLSAAKAAATSGQTIVVLPGNYTNHNLLKPGVDWFFYPGAKVTYYEPRASDGFGLFDDRSAGATTNSISGAGTFVYVGFTNLQTKGLLVVTNPSSRINFEADEILFSTFANGGLQNQAAIHNANSAEVFVNANTIWCPNYTNTITEGEDEFGPMVFPENSIPIYWSIGNLNVNAERIGPCREYAIRSTHAADRTSTNTLFISAKQVIGSVTFESSNSTNYNNSNWRSHLNIGYQQGKLHYGGTGDHYYRGGHIKFTDGGPAITIEGDNATTNLVVHLTLQKLTTTDDFCVQNTNSVFYYHVDHFEAIPVESGDLAGDAQHGNILTTVGGTAFISGGRATIMNGCAVSAQYSTVVISDLTVDNSGSIVTGGYGKGVIAKTGSSVTIKNCRFIVPPTGNPIYSDTAQNVAVYGVYGNNTNSSNITLSPNGGFWVDGNLYASKVYSDSILTSSTPATAGASGLPGQVRYDASYLYICTATNTWRRISHATW